MAPKKKKKVASNPARGFTTTSQPSKARTIDPDLDVGAKATSQTGAETSTPASESQHPIAAQNGQGSSSSIQDIVARLETDRRQSQAQSYAMHPSDWLNEDCLAWSLAQFDNSPVYREREASESNGDEKLLLDLWILHRVLAALKFPDIGKAIGHVMGASVSQSVGANSGLAYGLEEALDWYAFNYKQAELPYFQDQRPQPRVVDVRGGFRRHSVSRDRSPGVPNSSAGPRSADEAGSPQADAISSEGSSGSDDDDDDPSHLTDRWLRLKSRLWTKENEGHVGKVKHNRAVQKLTQKIAQIERDILFDIYVAEPQWTLVKVGLQREAATARATANVGTGSKSVESGVANGTGSPSVEDDDVLGDEHGLGAIFEDQQPIPSEPVETGHVQVRDMGKYAGLTPQNLLKQVAQSIDAKSVIKYTSLHQTTHSVRHLQIEMRTIATTSATSSADFVSALTLFLLSSLPEQDEKALKRLPSPWPTLFAELKGSRTRLSQQDEKDTLRQIREIIQSVRDTNDDNSQPTLSQLPHRPAAPAPRRRERPPLQCLNPEEARGAWTARASRVAFKKMLEVRAQLPIYRHKETILDTIANNPVVVVCAETGSGKSTQAGSYILEQQLMAGNDCHILVTQPRRISAISLARRVSQEIGEGRGDLGTLRSLVGYAIRLESKTSEATRLTFATTGVLLRMLETSPTLEQLDYLILDEVHERSMEMDLAFIALRQLQRLRPSLKIILMSATVNAKQFSDYFGGAPVLDIEGRTYPVTIQYLEDALECTNKIISMGGDRSNHVEEDIDTDEHETKKSTDRDSLKGYSIQTIRRLAEIDEYKINYDLIVRLAVAIATENAFIKFSKAILVFMPGIAEIRRLNSALLSHPTFAQKWDIHMLHSSFSTEDLEGAFVIPPPGRRKIVIATNIAETGITIPDVTAVIDTCKEKIMRFDERRQLSRLTEGFIAKSSAKQRRGRAARVQEGLCFHLVTKHRHDNLFLEQQVPEMLRLSLQDSIMRIKVWDADAAIEETLAAAIDPPSSKNVHRAIERLKEAGALDRSERLTPLGEKVSGLPLDVSLAKLAIFGTIFGCLEPVLTIISLMTSKSIFSAKGDGKAAFLRSGSDQLSALNAFESWQRASAAGQGPQFARKHHLVNLPEIDEGKIQLLVYLVDGGVVELNEEEKRMLSNARSNNRHRTSYSIPDRYNTSVSDDLLLSLLATSLYPRVLVSEGKGYRNCFSNQQATPASGSVIRAMPKPPQWLSFSEAMRLKAGNTIAIQEASRIPEMALSLFLGSDVDINLFSGAIVIDGRIRLSVADWKHLLAIKILRKQLRGLLSRRYRSVSQSSPEDENLIKRLSSAGVSSMQGHQG
ncbi:putative helicase [Cyphellophora attinorum]|uniref:RNA helicase n=1 Tax=Cyphellophora attinorum TaxID=1664694 RepID=A0A0N1NX80_9EURO|nr:putative helicase [Phialophora attinorum]KPI37754.1 putative helicase [Phialophora attinorum]